MLNRLPTPIVGLLLAVLTAGAHAAVLGWDTEYDVDPDTGQLSGPYGVGQVVLLAAVLLTLGLGAAWRGPAWLVFVVPVVATIAWSVSAATAPQDDGLWPVGAVLVAAATTAGALACRALVAAVRSRS